MRAVMAEAATRRAGVVAAHVTAPRSPVAPGFTVAVLGAGGGIGQPLSLLLKLSPLVSDLRLYDVKGTAGVACDVSHVDTPARCRGFTGDAQLGEALAGADLVVIPAGVPRKPGMTRDDLFNINAGIVRSLAEGVAAHCPGAVVNVISNPVNSTVAIAAEALKAKGCYNPRRLMGVTALDVARANTFVAEALGLPAGAVQVPVAGGHAGATILPLLSQAQPPLSLTAAEADALTKRVQDGGTEVVEAKAGAGSATLSMAYAAAQFAEACLRGLRGEGGVETCAFVASANVPGAEFFASRVTLGRGGVETVHPLGPLDERERAGLERMLPELKASIGKGRKFAGLGTA